MCKSATLLRCVPAGQSVPEYPSVIFVQGDMMSTQISDDIVSSYRKLYGCQTYTATRQPKVGDLVVSPCDPGKNILFGRIGIVVETFVFDKHDDPTVQYTTCDVQCETDRRPRVYFSTEILLIERA